MTRRYNTGGLKPYQEKATPETDVQRCPLFVKVALAAFVLVLTLACAPSPPSRSSPSPSSTPTTTSPAGSSTSEGEAGNAPPAAFAESCALCHGGLGQGGVGSQLRGTKLTIDQFRERIRQGGGGMPAFETSRLPEVEIEAIYRWLKDLSP